MRWFKLSLWMLVIVALVAFFLQNSARTTVLSFDIGVAAWKLASPISVPALMGAPGQPGEESPNTIERDAT